MKDYITYYSESRSRGRIEQDLLRKGICRNLIRTVCEEDLEDKLPDEILLMKKLLIDFRTGEALKLMKKLLEKKNYRAESADYLERRKLKAFLYRKGFSLDNIEKIL